MKKIKTVMIIQARIGSQRLPGKTMRLLAGKSLIYRILERVKRCKLLNEIIVAIPDTKENLVIIKECKKLDVKFFRGSENNLIERYYFAARFFNADTVVRLPAENFIPEPSEIDKIVKFHNMKNYFGYSTNLQPILGSGYPDGIGAEVFNFEALEYFYFNPKKVISYEHISLNFYNFEKKKAVYPKIFSVKTIKCPKKFSRPDLVFDINKQSQLNFARKIYNSLYHKKPNFSIIDVIMYLNN